MEKVGIYLRIPKDLKRKAERYAAKTRHRRISNLMEYLLREHLNYAEQHPESEPEPEPVARTSRQRITPRFEDTL